MKSLLLAGIVLAVSASSSWAMPRVVPLPSMELKAQPVVGWLDGIFGCPTSWFMVYVMPGSGCRPTMGRMQY